MHRAPAVSYRVARSRWYLRVVISLWLLGFSTSLALAHRQSNWAFDTVVFAVLLGAGFLSWRGWQRSPAGCLQWDGQHWHWSGLEESGHCQLNVLLDFQSVLLVCVRSDISRPVWLWLEQPEPVGLQWCALRRALVGSQRSPGAHGKADPAMVHEEDV